MRFITIYNLFVVTNSIFVIYISFQLIAYIKTKNTLNYVPSNAIAYLKAFQKGVITSSIATFESKQEILEIDSNNDEKNLVPNTNIPYDAKMAILYEGVNKTTIYFGMKKDNFAVYIPSSVGYQSGKLSDLKKGDTILLERTFKYDLQGKDYADNLFTRITKLNK